MRVMSLNVWGGKEYHPLCHYLGSGYFDIYCLQEVFSTPSLIGDRDLPVKERRLRLFSELARILPDHTGFFSASSDKMNISHDGVFLEGQEEPTSIGVAMFVRKNIAVEATGDIFVYGNRNSKIHGVTTSSPKSLQYAVVKSHEGRFNVFNFHGLWNGGGKKDCPERLEQSRNIKAFLDRFSGKKVLCGDFNLDPETESVGIIEGSGSMTNLISRFGVTCTRTKLYRDYKTGSSYADYFFVSPDVKVERFDVDSGFEAEVSDHAPLRLWCK